MECLRSGEELRVGEQRIAARADRALEGRLWEGVLIEADGVEEGEAAEEGGSEGVEGVGCARGLVEAFAGEEGQQEGGASEAGRTH